MKCSSLLGIWRILKTKGSIRASKSFGTHVPLSCFGGSDPFGDAEGGKSTASRQLDALVGELSDREIQILIATAQAILDAREDGEK